MNGQAKIKLTNGGAEGSDIESVSSSEVCLNGTVIFDAPNFNQNVTALEKSVALNEGDNTLTVLLKSKPGGQISIEIIQEVDADAAAVIGPDGGTIEITDNSSQLFGTTIHVPTNSVNENTIFTTTSLPHFTDLPLFPNYNDNISPIVEFNSSTPFNEPVNICLPINKEPSGELHLYVLDEISSEWSLLNNPVITTDYTGGND
ncbi:MAG: hypothetical protein SWO11_04795 [Thermodesulfobacteriota bacterium]|nr:hypothetical protein [Thermodesulfobacteriota bacterium]